MLKFNFTNETKSRVPKAFFQSYVDKMYKLMKKEVDAKLLKRDGELDLVLVDDKKIQELNADYRGKDKPTDVISFAYLDVTEYEQEEGDIIVGDIFISIDTTKRQAKEKGHTLNDELGILFVHGLLHCLGYDHNNDEEEEEMEKWARKFHQYP